MLKSMDIQVGDCVFQQEEALALHHAVSYLDPSLERKS